MHALVRKDINGRFWSVDVDVVILKSTRHEKIHLGQLLLWYHLLKIRNSKSKTGKKNLECRACACLIRNVN